MLWRELESGRMLGLAFDRNRPIERQPVDFYCAALRLAVDIDPIITHDTRALRSEKRRSNRLARLGISVLRFTDDEVIHNLDGVVGNIRRWVRSRHEHWGARAAAPVPASTAVLPAAAGASALRRGAPARTPAAFDGSPAKRIRPGSARSVVK